MVISATRRRQVEHLPQQRDRGQRQADAEHPLHRAGGHQDGGHFGEEQRCPWNRAAYSTIRFLHVESLGAEDRRRREQGDSI